MTELLLLLMRHAINLVVGLIYKINPVKITHFLALTLISI
ncbi:hypothetical protein QE439_003981 [Pedobacter agri]|nr:hypothetical protein [Pedobacter agri]